ncbi:MAG: hypothetical protein LBP81_03310, partial [Treponema sp.]|nr:hypothetical protein [Treponema sp.]
MYPFSQKGLLHKFSACTTVFPLFQTTVAIKTENQLPAHIIQMGIKKIYYTRCFIEKVTQIKADYPVTTAIGGQHGVNYAREKGSCQAGPFPL